MQSRDFYTVSLPALVRLFCFVIVEANAITWGVTKSTNSQGRILIGLHPGGDYCDGNLMSKDINGGFTGCYEAAYFVVSKGVIL